MSKIRETNLSYKRLTRVYHPDMCNISKGFTYEERNDKFKENSNTVEE